MIKDHLAEVNELFRSGFNCSQAVLSVFSEEYCITAETALKMASPFGGGLGGYGRTCGALTGALMVVGLKYGAARPDDVESKLVTRDKTRRLIEIFLAKHSSIDCNELVGFDRTNLGGAELLVMRPRFLSTCPGFLETVITFLEEEL